MHSSLVRAQTVFGFFTTVAFAVAGLIAFSDLLSPRTPSANISVEKLQVVRGRPHYYSTKKEEYAHIRFDLYSDLSSLFTWNTKQVFVYVTATWPSNSTDPSLASSSPAEQHLNEAVIWDTIITTPSSDYLSNASPSALKKLQKNTAGKPIDKSRGIISLKNVKPKYQITAPNGKLAELDGVQLRVHWNVQPWVGWLSWDAVGWTRGLATLGGPAWWKEMKGGVSRVFSLPALKSKEKA